ncbi:Predicted oxidoreductase, contains short-chain dehydrogenase (SDR) and DUF2520 domains [Acinetobacter marinus]|uniref:Predicted oxidoreductase, contains short-chain dehydrogenase (SDR) and DUF2520 domains n=1 Tax=Acinetobacter marinus TaxID=281375 RepID=A0A1G6P423_9GAMM|nr:Rossmann-like and DUF2520 domain-containing protein [Acinetobacter marinus]SDC74354.1 Predicted oxidoreductase, contains short-chain dehydrogenase (SDR) and DUF2520 domains [Acinetobacter marinus]
MSDHEQLKISIIGTGRVATHLALHLHQQNQKIQYIFNRSVEKAQVLADQVHATAIDDLAQINDTDILLICVSDSAITQISEKLSQINYQGLVAHTSGSTALSVLSNLGRNAGVFYPLQTFSFEQKIDWQSTPIFIEAKSVDALHKLEIFAENFSSKIYQYNSEQRLSLHLAAVFACNFSNYCYDIAQQILDEKQVDVDLLQPLIDATAEKLKRARAVENQTGPAVRHDQQILAMHQLMLTNHTEWQTIYQLMSQGIQARTPKN